MIGRGAIGNPFIFQDIAAELEGHVPAQMTPQKRLQIYLSLVRENVAYYGEKIGVNRSRKTAGYWISNFAGASDVRGRFVRLEKFTDIEQLFQETLQKI